MAAHLPSALKGADLQRFATRAAQLEKPRPIAAYWLEYYILNQILGRQLHATSTEVENYAVNLISKLEQTKATYSAESAIMDDTVAKAYMEEFAAEVFDRAEKAQNTDKVTKQTAEAFGAASTFYDSLVIWSELDVESKRKSKFAKFHALRIARALKEGKDPNENNPKIDVPTGKSTEDELEAELDRMEVDAAHQQPSVESVPDHEALASHSTFTSQPEISPVVELASADDRPVSIGGGYFPDVPSVVDRDVVSAMDAPHIDEETHIPRQATVADMMSSNIDDETHIPAQPPAIDPAQFYKTSTQPATISQATTSRNAFKTDEDAVMAAQKHAKWAISALNFEDVPTAVKELRIALQSLGGL